MKERRRKGEKERRGKVGGKDKIRQVESRIE